LSDPFMYAGILLTVSEKRGKLAPPRGFVSHASGLLIPFRVLRIAA